MFQGKFFFAFLLVILLVVEDANGGWGRKLWRKTKKHLKKVGEIAQTVATVKTVAGVIGKRSTEGVSKIVKYVFNISVILALICSIRSGAYIIVLFCILIMY